VLSEIYNFLPLTNNLLSSGMPTADQVTEIAQSGVQMVINLAPFDPERDLQDEASLVKSAGMEYLSIPVEWDAPAQKDLQAFIKAMEANTDRKVLVHCRANFRATGFVTLYRILRLGWKPDEAFKDLRRIWNPEDYPVWKKFIDDNLSKNSAYWRHAGIPKAQGSRRRAA
jgi:uncharacterized protein (TIGR01244 family)